MPWCIPFLSCCIPLCPVVYMCPLCPVVSLYVLLYPFMSCYIPFSWCIPFVLLYPSLSSCILLCPTVSLCLAVSLCALFYPVMSWCIPPLSPAVSLYLLLYLLTKQRWDKTWFYFQVTFFLPRPRFEQSAEGQRSEIFTYSRWHMG